MSVEHNDPLFLMCYPPSSPSPLVSVIVRIGAPIRSAVLSVTKANPLWAKRQIGIAKGDLGFLVWKLTDQAVQSRPATFTKRRVFSFQRNWR